MSVTPYDHGRFLVESRRPGADPHLVDLFDVPEGSKRPRPTCGCWEHFCKGNVCVHMERVVEYVKERLSA